MQRVWQPTDLQPTDGALVNAQPSPFGNNYDRPASAYPYDVLIDLSSSVLGRESVSEYIDQLVCETGLAATANSVTLRLHEESGHYEGVAKLSVQTGGQPDAVERLIRKAASLGHHVVIALGALLPGNELIKRLIDEFDRDPMFGTVQPRFGVASTDLVWPLPGDGEVPVASLPRAALALLPERTITPELLSALLIIRRQVVMEMDPAELRLESIAGKLRLLLTRARRRGYRNVVCNHCAVASELPHGHVYPLPVAADGERLQSVFPEVSRADRQCSNLPQRRLERLLSRTCSGDAGERRHLLLDCRGMIARHNGTAHCILGFLRGFHELEGPWRFEVLASAATIEFFGLRKCFPGFTVHSELPAKKYTAGILLNQPFGMSTVAELHRSAFIVGFNILDTIAWDILYASDESFGPLWGFAARFADVLFYNSWYTRDRFVTRFPLQPQVAECVTHHSVAEDEQVEPSFRRQPKGDHILVLGNDYDHKDVARTLKVLVDAFPFERFVAIGITDMAGPNVTVMESGYIETEVLQRLIATARAVVIPSFYEGFGMPVVQALAYGRKVIVRLSRLWDEIAGICHLPGELSCFENVPTLVEAVGRALRGEPGGSIAQGDQLGPSEAPLRWRDCSQRMVNAIEKLVSAKETVHWRARDEALQSIQVLRY